MQKLIILLLFINSALASTIHAQKKYVKSYYSNGKLKSEGWVANNDKIDYWVYYHSNGKRASEGHYFENKQEKYWYFYSNKGVLEKEGHFSNGLKNKWWVFYNKKGKPTNKKQFLNDRIEGYCIKYKNDKIFKIEKYVNNSKIKEWTDFEDFQKENKLTDLI